MAEIKPEWVDALSVAHAEMCDEDMRESGGRYLRTMGEFYVPFLEAVAPLIAADARREALEEAAKLASWAHMVPPDGGSPTEDECRVAETAAAGIRALIDKDARAAALDALGELDGETP